MSECVFCGGVATTKEHIIPRWLQKHFDLKDNHLGMINGTKMQYSKVVVPACKKCNSEIFSRLESKVRKNTANDQEYYLWALKIRYCLSLLDLKLPNDRSEPSLGPMLHKQYATVGHEFIRHAFKHLELDRFFFRPYPFGTVLISNNPNKDGKFGLVDITHPYWVTSIALPNHRVLSVLFNDRGFVHRSIKQRFKNNKGPHRFSQNIDLDIETPDFVKVITFKLLIWQYQIANIPLDISLEADGVFSGRLPSKIKYRSEMKLSVLNEIAQYCGIPNEVALEIHKLLGA